MITYKRSFVMLVLLPFGSYFFMNLGFFYPMTNDEGQIMGLYFNFKFKFVLINNN